MGVKKKMCIIEVSDKIYIIDVLSEFQFSTFNSKKQ